LITQFITVSTYTFWFGIKMKIFIVTKQVMVAMTRKHARKQCVWFLVCVQEVFVANVERFFRRDRFKNDMCYMGAKSTIIQVRMSALRCKRGTRCCAETANDLRLGPRICMHESGRADALSNMWHVLRF
jgi:hypothetical protein